MAIEEEVLEEGEGEVMCERRWDGHRQEDGGAGSSVYLR